MATYRIVAGMGLLSAVVGLACGDSPTQPDDSLPQFGPVRSLTLSVTPDRLPNPGPVTIDLRATTDYETTGARTARVRVTTTTGEQAVALCAVLVVPLFGVCPP